MCENLTFPVLLPQKIKCLKSFYVILSDLDAIFEREAYTFQGSVE